MLNKKKRELKGKSIMDLPTDYCLIDIETTGLDASIDDAIEVAILRVRENKVIAEYESLIYTKNILGIFIEELTGIRQKEIDSAPLPSIVWKEVKEFINNDILMAHNANFDINFIYDEMEENNIEPISNDYIDTLRLARRAFPTLKNHKLKTLVKELKLSDFKIHRAKADVLLTKELYDKIGLEITKDELELINKRKKLNIEDIKVINEIKNDYIIDNTFCFTGKLELYERKEAMQIVINSGGYISKGLTKKVNYLVMGTYDYYQSIKDGKSSKHKKAEEYKLKGCEINIIPENIFYEMLTQGTQKDK